MSEHLQADRAWAAGVLAAAAGVTVTYTRGQRTATLTAVPTAGRSGGQLHDSFQIVWEGTDWLCSSADLILGEGAILPEPGDRITCGELVYEAMAPAAGEHCFAFRDQPFNRLLRIHTKRVE